MEINGPAAEQPVLDAQAAEKIVYAGYCFQLARGGGHAPVSPSRRGGSPRYHDVTMRRSSYASAGGRILVASLRPRVARRLTGVPMRVHARQAPGRQVPWQMPTTV